MRIINFVEDGEDGYIVMDYVGGRSLKDLRQSGLDGQSGKTPLPVDQAIELMLAVLPALGYLHDRGLVFCDFKPDNVIQSGDQVKLIDLGGVRRLDDPPGVLYGTIGYQAPEVPEVGPSVASDLYTVARSLAVLTLDFRGYQTRFATSLPDPSAVPVFQRYPSFHWFLLRATDPDPARRFASVEEMAEQLTGVYRQVLAIDGDPDSPVPSVVFTPEVLVEPDRADWRNLPMPNVDPADPGATLLASLSGVATVPPEQLLVTLLAAPPSPEIAYRIAHTYLDADRGDDAAAALADADPDDWRTAWWQGVQRLAGGDAPGAVEIFGSLARYLPGELAPRLALAVAAETAGDRAPDAASDAVAASHYDLVSAVDPGYSSASFGLARTRRRAGDRAGAAEALTRIPNSSIWSTAAQIERCRILSGLSLGQPPTVWDLTEASVGLDRSTADAGLRAGVRRDLLEAALDLLDHGGAQPDPTIQIAGAPLQPQDLRVALEGTYRLLAKAAGNDAERVALIDAANRSRPRTLV